jgi:hypothetical protein
MLRRLGAICVVVALAACGGSDDGDDDGANPDAADPGGPPTLPGSAGQWTWMDVAGTRCADGSPTGMGVNLGTSADLVIFMEGGGACFNAFTCASVAHQNGFDSADLAGAVQQLGGQGIIDRTDPTNPLREATFVFFPYCTGDIFAGANESGFGGRTQVGYTNVGLYSDVLVAASDPVRRIVISGVSAGGFGALYNYDRIQKSFAAARAGRPTFLIDDSGPPLPDEWLTPCLQTTLRTVWNLNETLPADCAACRGADGGGLVNALPYLADMHPDDRLALITSTTDGVIRSFYGFGYPTCNSTNPMPEAAYTAAVTSLRTDVIGTRANFKMFTITGGGHVWMLNPLSETMTGGTSLGSWLTAMLDGSASWDHASP